jgi:hypothetical protein
MDNVKMQLSPELLVPLRPAELFGVEIKIRGGDAIRVFGL